MGEVVAVVVSRYTVPTNLSFRMSSLLRGAMERGDVSLHVAVNV